MSKQHPNPEKVANELSGASAFFKRPVIEPTSSPPPTPEPEIAATIQPTLQTTTATENPETATRTPRTGVLPVRPAKRQMIRHPFELYMDQLDQLRDLADAERRRGEPGSMSRMVREAIDHFLDGHPAVE
jgi:hypothetical protein